MGSPRIPLLQFLTDFRIGGTERQVVNLATRMDAGRFEVQMACFRRLGQFKADIEAQGLPLTEYPIHSLCSPRTPLQQLRLARDVRRRGIRVVHSYGFYPNVFALPAARLGGAAVAIASIRDIGDHLRPWQLRAQRWACALADRVVVNAEAVRQRLMREGYDGEDITVIHNGIALDHFRRPADGAALRREMGLPQEAPLVVVASRLTTLKGIEYFLEAAARVASRRHGPIFLVVGDAVSSDPEPSLYRRALERQAQLLGLGTRLRFTGFREDVPQLLQAATVSVLPSLSEGLSNVVLESMAAGVPVVATAVGGNPEMLEDGVNGFLVPARDPAALADAIDAVLADPARGVRLGEAGRRRVEEQFSLPVMVRRTEALYDELLWDARAARPGRARALARRARSLTRMV